MENKPETPVKAAQPQISVGAGIAIAAIWVMSTILLIVLMVLCLIWPDPFTIETWQSLVIVVAIIIAPWLVAIAMTKRILGQQDS